MESSTRALTGAGRSRARGEGAPGPGHLSGTSGTTALGPGHLSGASGTTALGLGHLSGTSGTTALGPGHLSGALGTIALHGCSHLLGDPDTRLHLGNLSDSSLSDAPSINIPYHCKATISTKISNLSKEHIFTRIKFITSVHS